VNGEQGKQWVAVNGGQSEREVMMVGTDRLESRHVGSFEDLDVYRLSREVAGRVHELSKAFPPDERYSLTDQLRRSSRSIGAQIAEAWGKRRFLKHFVSKLTDADGEQYETRQRILLASDFGYISNDERDEVLKDLQYIGRMLQSMKDKAELFCRDALVNGER
jgi:four helix bundle protein